MAYLPLSTANLPDPVIDPAQGASPEDYFNTVLYTGTSDDSAKVITGVGFQPDFIWSKGRSGTYAARDHFLRDAVRGANKNLHSNTTDAEATDSGNSFDSDGVTLSADYGQNGLNTNHVMWSWKANGSGVSNNAGSITSTVSANTTSGFSIVKYGGTGSAATVGHGLDQAPEMVIVKSMEGPFSWSVFHTSLGGTKNIFLNLTNAASTDSSHWNNTDPTSTVFSVGTNNGTNDSRYNHIAYCFHSVEGFSKIGTYEGTNNANGPFIYLGFKPKFFMLKNVDSALQWIIFDGERDPFNVVGKRLFPATTNGDSPVPSNSAMDFTSNGVKIRIAGGYDVNDTGTYIYMAFAENPFKYSNAR